MSQCIEMSRNHHVVAIKSEKKTSRDRLSPWCIFRLKPAKTERKKKGGNRSGEKVK